MNDGKIGSIFGYFKNEAGVIVTPIEGGAVEVAVSAFDNAVVDIFALIARFLEIMEDFDWKEIGLDGGCKRSERAQEQGEQGVKKEVQEIRRTLVQNTTPRMHTEHVAERGLAGKKKRGDVDGPTEGGLIRAENSSC